MNDIQRIEQKVDGLSEKVDKLQVLIERLARIDEKLVNQKEDVIELEKEVHEQTRIISDLKVKVAVMSNQGNTVSRWVERLIIFLVLGALATYNFFKG